MNPDKLEAQKQWNTTPCGTGDYLSGVEYASLEFFERVRWSRYEVTDKWMKKFIDFDHVKEKKLLEIGFGIGTDLLTFAENGAEVYGIDITQKHYELAQKNFELHKQKCNLKLCDAAEIDFPSSFFDIVYSNGVLHHTPDTIRCISEAYRVLKPGGTMIVTMYNRYSAFHIFTKLLFEGVLLGKLWKLGYPGLMATIEHGADGITIKPLVKTFSKKQMKLILSDFTSVDIKVGHFTKAHFRYLGRLIPHFLERYLEPIFGWYIIAYAVK